MIATDLFEISEKFSANVKRNVASVSKSSEAFSSLINNDEDNAAVADLAIHLARESISRQNNLDSFYYTTAIEYPFKTQPYMQTRYSDGTFPVWYGSMGYLTTIYETAYHCVKDFLSSEIINETDSIIRKRTIYDINCQSYLLNIVGKEVKYPDLVNNNYVFTNSLAREAKTNKIPGIMSPSARHHQGININIFNIDVLSSPKHNMNLSYQINHNKQTVSVCGLANNLHIPFDELRF